jgi:putative transposase
MAQKKMAGASVKEKRKMVEKENTISMNQQCKLLSIHRSGLYYKPRPESEENLLLMRLLDEQYFKTPFYGYRKLAKWLSEKGFSINKKRVKRLMRLMGWQTLFRKPSTSWKNAAHKVYPYLLKDIAITHANQSWGIDITYVPMKKGFLYLCAIIDLHTRYVVNWSISNTMTAPWVRSIVEEAIAEHGKPEIINSDQGSQFTSEEYLSLFTDEKASGYGIKISMDGKGRAIDNIFIERLWKSVKYENIYLHAYEDGVQLYEGLKNYFQFYNHERMHQSLDYKTPASQYKMAA